MSKSQGPFVSSEAEAGSCHPAHKFLNYYNTDRCMSFLCAVRKLYCRGVKYRLVYLAVFFEDCSSSGFWRKRLACTCFCCDVCVGQNLAHLMRGFGNRQRGGTELHRQTVAVDPYGNIPSEKTRKCPSSFFVFGRLLSNHHVVHPQYSRGEPTPASLLRISRWEAGMHV